MKFEKLDTILFIICLIIFGMLLFNISDKCYGANVTDDAKGNKGYILINNGTGQGHQGTWTDIKTVPELKGAKGDKGDTGAQGIQGIAGNNGLNGADGADFDPAEVTRLDNKVDTETLERKDDDVSLSNRINSNSISINDMTTINKNQDKTLQDHENRIEDLDNRVGDLEKTQYKIQTEFRILDTEKISVSPYISNNINRHKLDEAGIRITIKLGSSYEEREIAETNKRLDVLEKKIGLAPIITKTLDSKGKVKSIELTNGWNVKGEF